MFMKISYAKLWKLMIDMKMKKKDLREYTGLSSSSVAKLSKDKPVSMDVLYKICKELKCNIGDIVEFIYE